MKKKKKKSCGEGPSEANKQTYKKKRGGGRGERQVKRTLSLTNTPQACIVPFVCVTHHLASQHKLLQEVDVV